jgi:hypothetical protein
MSFRPEGEISECGKEEISLCVRDDGGESTGLKELKGLPSFDEHSEEKSPGFSSAYRSKKID